MIVGRRLEMNAAAVFLSVAFWGYVWGVVGMFLAVPVMVEVPPAPPAVKVEVWMWSGMLAWFRVETKAPPSWPTFSTPGAPVSVLWP